MELVTIKEATTVCNLSYQQIRDACRCGAIAAVKSTGDGKWYLNRFSLEEYAEKRQRR